MRQDYEISLVMIMWKIVTGDDCLDINHSWKYLYKFLPRFYILRELYEPSLYGSLSFSVSIESVGLALSLPISFLSRRSNHFKISAFDVPLHYWDNNALNSAETSLGLKIRREQSILCGNSKLFQTKKDCFRCKHY